MVTTDLGLFWNSEDKHCAHCGAVSEKIWVTQIDGGLVHRCDDCDANTCGRCTRGEVNPYPDSYPILCKINGDDKMERQSCPDFWHK